MWAYIARRLLLAIPTLFVVTVVTFFIVMLEPKQPLPLMIMGMCDDCYPPEIVELIRAELGINQLPLHAKYLSWLMSILTLDFGHSDSYGASIGELLRRKVPLSLQLGMLSILLGGILGIAGGIIAALKPNTVVDYLVRGLSTLGISLPTFLSGMLLILLLVKVLAWIPEPGYTPVWVDPLGNMAQLTLPALVIGLGLIMGAVLRMMRSSLLEAMSSDYVRLARAKGMKERIVIVRHALPNAIIPVITLIGTFAPFTITGLVVTEQIFGLPGVGRMMIDAAHNRDYQVVQIVILLTALAVIITNLVVDLLYVRLDPRLRYWKNGP